MKSKEPSYFTDRVLDEIQNNKNNLDLAKQIAIDAINNSKAKKENKQKGLLMVEKQKTFDKLIYAVFQFKLAAEGNSVI